MLAVLFVSKLTERERERERDRERERERKEREEREREERERETHTQVCSSMHLQHTENRVAVSARHRSSLEFVSVAVFAFAN